MTILTQTSASVKRDQYNDAREAIDNKLASWVWDRPLGVSAAVQHGEAAWLSDRPTPHRDAPCCPAVESMPCAACLLLPFPVASLVPCPRCDGLGLRQFAVSCGIETETCTSCDGEGEVDAKTAEAIEALMDAAHAAADPDGWDDVTRWTVIEPPAETTPSERDRFAVLLSSRRDYHRHEDTSPDAEWAAEQFAELLRLARITDASDVGQMLDRLSVLDRHFG